MPALAQNQDTWKDLLIATQRCEQLYKDVQNDLEHENLLPKFGLALLQQQLASGQRTDAVAKIVETRLQQIQRREVRVLIAGEISAGKSTFLNVLMGGDYLPMTHGITTRLICELHHHHDIREAKIVFKDGTEPTVIQLPADRDSEEWMDLTVCIKKKVYSRKEVDTIVITWPLPVVQDIEDAFTSGLTQASVGPRQPSDRQTPDGKSPQSFDSDFIIYMRKPHADSFVNSHEETIVLPTQHNTDVKEVVPSGIETSDTPRQNKTDVKEVVRSTIELNNDSAHTRTKEHTSVETNETDETKLKVPYTDSERGRTDPNTNLLDSISSAHRASDIIASMDETSDVEPPGGNDTVQESSKEPDKFEFVFLDSPGINERITMKEFGTTIAREETEGFRTILQNVNLAHAFIFVINTCNHHGVDRDRLQALMEDIECEMESQSVIMNYDSSLFIANKIDFVPEDDRKDLKDVIVSKLREKWPLVDKYNVIEMQASQVLAELKTGRDENKDKVYNKIRTFLMETVRVSLEEHCMWLLNMLETAHAIAKAGKQWSELRKTKMKLMKTLREKHEQASILYERIAQIEFADIHREAWSQLSRLVSEKMDSSTELLHWIEDDFMTNDVIKKYKTLGWPDISKEIDILISNRLVTAVSEALQTVQKQYKTKLDERFKTEQEEVNQLERMLQGVLSDSETRANTRTGFFTVVAPIVIAGSVRLAPIVYPAAFLAAPLLHIPLLVMSIIGEFRDYKNETEREEFIQNSCQYVENRTRQLVNIFKNSLDTRNSNKPPSELFERFFEEANKIQLLHAQLETIMEGIRYLLEDSLRSSEGNRSCSQVHIVETMKLYASDVIKHNIKEEDITWFRDSTRAGDRRILGFGAQASVYEAELKLKEFRGDLDKASSKARSTIPSNVHVYRECFLMRQLSKVAESQLVKYYGSNFVMDNDKGTFSLQLVLERCIGTLQIVIEGSTTKRTRDKAYLKRQFLYYTQECAKGLGFLHNNNIVHRDVKPSNFLLRTKNDAMDDEFPYQVVISDIGCSKLEHVIKTEGRNVGTRQYWAPEIALMNAFHSKASDMYSLGLVVWDLWFRRSVHEQYNIWRGEIPRERAADVDVNRLIYLCLQRKPEERFTAKLFYARTRKGDG